jgi:hypothetical protein
MLQVGATAIYEEEEEEERKIVHCNRRAIICLIDLSLRPTDLQ